MNPINNEIGECRRADDALPKGAAWTIGQDVFSDEIGRIRVEGGDPEGAHEFMMQTMVAYFDGTSG